MNIMNAFIPLATAHFRRSASLLFIACAVFQEPAFAVQLKTLLNFNYTNGAHPATKLAIDTAGKLYGTTREGGKYPYGTVFQLTPPAPGQTIWTRKTLVNFNNTNGASPAAELVFDAAGRLYGTTIWGGQYDVGTVFQLTPPAVGKTAWTQKTLVNFNNSNGASPAALVLDAAGKLYGTTSSGGKYGYGTVFQLTPPASGQTTWTRKTLVDFNGSNGKNPSARLVIDAAGKLYGTTPLGGQYDVGTVFQLTPPAPGQTTWTRKTLVNFNFANGAYPHALVFDASGKLYGTTFNGGQHSDGTVFQLTPPTPGHTAWTRKTLVNFNSTNGANPSASLVFDAAGHLYGTTTYGGQYGNSVSGYGTVFQMTPPAPGQTAWTLKKLVDFDGTNGKWPGAGLVLDAVGKLYGTTSAGGQYDFGTVFQLTP